MLLLIVACVAAILWIWVVAPELAIVDQDTDGVIADVEMELNGRLVVTLDEPENGEIERIHQIGPNGRVLDEEPVYAGVQTIRLQPEWVGAPDTGEFVIVAEAPNGTSVGRATVVIERV